MLTTIQNYIISHLTPADVQMYWRAFLSLLVGAMIGIERGASGRAAGFRTYILVCLSSTLLMFVPAFPHKLEMVMGASTPIIMDPTRVIQGIITGIGFLGAAVIFRDGFTLRGITSAAAIWLTSTLGILIGVGFEFEAMVGTLFTFLTLSILSKVGRILPSKNFAQLEITVSRTENPLSQEDLVAMLAQHNFHVVDMTYSAVNKKHGVLVYTIRMWSKSRGELPVLNKTLSANEKVLGYVLAPAVG